MAIARGELKSGPDEPKVWFTSTESFAKVMKDGGTAVSLSDCPKGLPILKMSPNLVAVPR